MMIRELIQGQEAATQLKPLLQNPIRVDGSLSRVDELVTNVLRSFTQALSLLSSFSYDGETLGGDEVAHRDLPSSGENGLPVVAPGNYVPRKTAQTWTTVSHTTDDTHAWRKYGQKGILNSKFPRGYFRCTKKYDEGCMATKQVQRTQENPDMFEITYIGIHTCKATLLTDTTNTNREESYLANNKETNHLIKQEYYLKEESPSDDANKVEDHHKFYDPIQWSDWEDIEQSKPNIINMPLKLASSDNADIVHYSYTGSQSLDIDFFGGFRSF
ncbi:hypothetical protein RIF29_17010 [Crotalaria pallida]|uniref:WRKY domain-containing protein n=1 Tax=Crotalaria pallida TaxID=3830 RepID=A0AAN9FHN4_CROPI